MFHLVRRSNERPNIQFLLSLTVLAATSSPTSCYI
jgi:hypothetical protein